MADNQFAAMTAPAAAKSPAPPPSVARTAPGKPRWAKYTIELPPDVRLSVSEDVMRLAEITGLTIDRRHVTIALYRALHTDESLFEDVARRLPRIVAELEQRRDG